MSVCLHFLCIFRYFPSAPKYVYHHDLALVRVTKEIPFDKKVMPICFPGSKRFPDTSGVVYTAGWGYRAEHICKTGSQGPDPFSRCKFPFIWGNVPHSACSSIPSPSSHNKVCSDLHKFGLNGKPLPSKGYSRVRIQ